MFSHAAPLEDTIQGQIRDVRSRNTPQQGENIVNRIIQLEEVASALEKSKSCILRENAGNGPCVVTTKFERVRVVGSHGKDAPIVSALTPTLMNNAGCNTTDTIECA